MTDRQIDTETPAQQTPAQVDSEDPPSFEGRRMQSALLGRLFGVQAPPVRIGRFVIADVIARGGMGTVYRAYDARLDRRVAVKVLNERREITATRLDREARALAQLNHPNVVTIHEVGDDEAGVFVAMEYVDGGTLAQWFDPELPLTRERLGRLLSFAEQAAQGLIAAHALGLVHRDLKPANMLIGRDGRLRLADFGLVAHDAESPRASGDDDAALAVDTPLTATGSLIGTPAFMAPEQFDGHADARSDQFSYCASFYWALHGVRPYGGTSIGALRKNLAAGTLQIPPGSKVPRDVHAVLARGLRFRAAERFTDMTELLAALRAGRSRRSWIRAGAVAAVVAGGGVLAIAAAASADDPCVDGPTRIASAWNPDRRATVRASITAVDVGFADATAERIDERLSAYAAEWVDGYRAACEATLVERRQSRELMTARMRCLDRRQRDLAALVGVLERADATVVENATRSVGQLSRVETCADPSSVATASPIPDDPESAAEAVAIDDTLALASAALGAGKYGDALGHATDAVQRAERLGFGPALLRALNGLARAEHALGRPDAALAAATRGFILGETDDEDAAIANHRVLGAIFDARAEYGESVAHQQRALTLRSRGASLDDPDVAEIHSSLGDTLRSMGDHDRSAEHLTIAVTTLANTVGEADLATALAHARLGATLTAQGRYDDALSHLDRGLSSATLALGPDHPEIASFHKRIGGTLRERGDLARALEHQRRALEIRRAALGERNLGLAELHLDLAHTLGEQGDYAAAIAHQRQAIDVATGADGADPPALAASYAGLGLLFARKGDVEPALENLRRALGMFERQVGENHASVAQTLLDLAYTLQAKGDLAGGLAHFERALVVATRVFDDGHPMLADIHAGLGSAMVVAGRFAEALEHHRRAQAIDLTRFPEGHATHAADRNAIGEALRLLGRHEEALVEHRAALEIQVAGLGGDHPYTATSHLGLGHTLGALGEWPEALEAFRAAASVIAKAHGEGHRGVVLGTTGAVVSASALGRAAQVQAELARLRAAVEQTPTPGTANAVALAEAVAIQPRSRASEQAVRNAAAALERQGERTFGPIVASWLERRGSRRATTPP